MNVLDQTTRTVPSMVQDFFLSYVVIDTQADPNSKTVPTTPGQLELGKLLVEQLTDMGITDIEHDDMGYIYATIPSIMPENVPVPVIAFLAHLDTSPDCSGKDVIPLVWENYDGKDLVLPDDETKVIRPTDCPALLDNIGNTIITASGTTLLGADNKSGIAAIMDAAYYLMKDPAAPPHGEIRLVFTPDEEIGRDAENIDLDKVGAVFAYTMDGGPLGDFSYENFTAAGCDISIKGFSTHPGFALNTMEPAAQVLRFILNELPPEKVPELTQGRQPFIHVIDMSGKTEEAKVNFILRDFTDDGMQVLYGDIEMAVSLARKKFPKSEIVITFEEQYRNMAEKINETPEVRDNALEAIRMAGIEPVVDPIRGGTTGAWLSWMGLPTPNIFCGEHTFHSVLEWTTVEEMKKSSEVVANICQVFAEKANQ